MEEVEADWGVIGRYGGHPVVIDVVRTGAVAIGSPVDVVAFHTGRSVVLGSDVARVMDPRLPTAAERALFVEPIPQVVADSSAAPLRSVDGRLFGAVSTNHPVDARGLSILGGLACLLEHHLATDAPVRLATDGAFAGAVLDGLRDLVVVLTPNFDIAWCNGAVGSQLSLTPADLIGHNIADLLHPDDLPNAIDAAIRLRSGFTTFRMLLRVRHGRGDFEPMEVFGLDRSMDPEVGGFVVSLRSDDRTGNVERELDRSRRVSDSIIGGLTDAVIAADPAGGVRVINHAARVLFGIDPTTPAAAITPDDLVLLDRSGHRIPGEEHPMRIGRDVSPEHLECCVSNATGLRYVVLQSRRVSQANDEDLGVVMTLQDVTDAVAAGAELEASAFIDQLTGLPNRRQLEQGLEELGADPEPRSVGVCFLDLDGFKLINDVHGHRVGDELLRIAGMRLQSALRDGDVLARQGGDEFVAVLLDVDNEPEAIEIADRLRVVLSDPFEIDGTSLHVTASVGVVVDQVGTTMGDLLLQRADIAMYAAKAAGRNRVELFDDALAARSATEQRNREMIRTALSTNGLVMHFQPLVDTESARVIGMEALVRCQMADGSILGPGAFLDDLGESQLLVELDRRAFHLSCLGAVRLAAVDDVWVACNFSPASLRQRDLVEFVLATVDEVGISPDRVCIEVTESGAFDSGESNIKSLRRLREAGFGIALDDFGTGYSSLAHLRDLPLSVVKLDRSFVTKLHRPTAERAIASAIVRLSEELGFSVVAEGIETTSQFEAARALGFNVMQGWHFAPALDLADAVALLGPGSIVLGADRASA